MRQPIVNIDIVRGPIEHTFQQIGYDLETACAEQGTRMRNSHVIEACIDADRLTFFARNGGDQDEAKAADAEIERAIKEHGYEKVLRALSRAIHLV